MGVGRGGEDETLGWNDFLNGAAHGVDGVVRRVHVHPDRAADAGIKFTNGISEAFRPPPLCEVMRFGP